MSDKQKVFLDTNLLIYAHTNVDILKQKKIHQIIISENTVISTQVFKEAANVLSKKFRFDWQLIQIVLHEMQQNNIVHTTSFPSIHRACQIADRYGFSFYDSLILSAALESGCSILYTEDLHHGLVIEDTLTLINPFI